MILKKQLWLYTSSPKGLTDIGLGFLEDSLLNTRRIGSESESPSDRHKYHHNKGYSHAVLLETVPFSQHSSSGEDEDEEAPQKKQQTIVDS